MKRLAAILTLSAMAMISSAHAAPPHQSDWAAPYAGAYTLQGDDSNIVSANAATGELVAIRRSLAPGSFGCGGSAGFAYLKTADFTLTSNATHIGFNYEDALLTAYSWLKVTLHGPEGPIGTGSFRGVLEVLPGSGAVEYELLDHQKAVALAGTPVRVEVGLEMSSACPNVDGGVATITGIWVA